MEPFFCHFREVKKCRRESVWGNVCAHVELRTCIELTVHVQGLRLGAKAGEGKHKYVSDFCATVEFYLAQLQDSGCVGVAYRPDTP